MLSDRKRKILKAVVDDYIESAEPVSSKNICDKYLTDCSPATVRNELSALESMGYLVQPHVSAGRIPSQKAFRMYVDELMTVKPLSNEEIEVIDKYFQQRAGNVEELVMNVAKIISDITNYTSVVVKNKGEEEYIRRVTVVELNEKSALVVIVTDNSVLKDSIIDLPIDLDENGIKTANNWLNRVFCGKKVSEISNIDVIMSDISIDFALYRELYKKIVEILKKCNKGGQEITTSGSSKILDYPEYNDIDKAKDFLTKLETKSDLMEIFDTSKGDFEMVIKIGQEQNNMPEGCSMVSAKINVKDKMVGSAGVIGPIRMDYKKIVSVLEHIGQLIDKMLSDQ
ncbi:MAG: heat-inducible transcriptional repressor HrcA [Clostridia bacterium]